MTDRKPSANLDPSDWSDVRALAHRMVDDMIDRWSAVGEGPVWRQMPASARAAFSGAMPRQAMSLEAAYDAFTQRVVPYALGNMHPRFMGWVHGGGNPAGALAEFLAAGLNTNLGGRDHAPIEVERQVIRWAAEMLGFPAEAGGLLVTGSSMANFIGLLVARATALGTEVRRRGAGGERLVAYTSAAAHGCIPRAMDMSGLGTDALRMIPCGPDHGIDVAALSQAIARDRAAGATPFLVVGTAGSVDTGAIDDLAALADVCATEHIAFHVDAAFAALGMLTPTVRPRLRGIERANSIAFDFHKWAQVPYDAGCILVRDQQKELETFSFQARYLRRHPRGLAGGQPWPCDLGPDLSRGFRALKVWFTFMTYGADRLGQVVEEACARAQALAARIDREPELERLAPVPLNIVCFRYKAAAGDLDDLNSEIVADVQESGIAAPSTTSIGGKLAIRAALFNHRTREEDVHILVDAVLKYGRARTAEKARA